MSDLGLTNNNPTNIRYTGIAWAGLADPPHDALGFCVFKTMEAGLAAGAKNLHNQQALHGLNTITAIISRLSPPTENNTAAYISLVAEHMGIAADATVDLNNHAQLAALLEAVVTQEIGAGHVTNSQIMGAVNAALVSEHPPVSAPNAENMPVISAAPMISSAYTAAGSGAAITMLPYVQWALDGFHSAPPQNMAALIAAGLATAAHYAYNRWLK